MTRENYLTAPLPMAGDEIIDHPTVAWDTLTTIPREPEATWALLSRIGLAEEQGAGYFLPKSTERWLPAKVRSIDMFDPDQLPPQRQVGDRLRDVPKDSVAEVAVLDNDTRALALDSRWPSGLHYTWALQVESHQHGTQIRTRARLENPQHPHLLRLVGPRADQWGMEKVGQGLVERLPASEETQLIYPSTRQSKMLLGSLAGLATGELLQCSQRPAVRNIGSLVSIVAGVRAGYRLAKATDKS